MRYFIIAGEASGDLHASHLMGGIKKKDPEATFCFFGGDLMAEQGGTLLKHYREMAFMGFFTVLKNLGKIKKNFKLAEGKLIEFQPDVLILVDYPGFNLRMARFAKAHNIKTFYYISPKIWAWRSGRVKWIKNYVDELFAIFPFEKDFYDKHNYRIRYVGNPTVDELAVRPNRNQTCREFISENGLEDKPIVALLSGSRRQEIKLILPTLTQVATLFPDYQFVIAGAPSLTLELYHGNMPKNKIPVIFGKTYELLQQSKAAVVASGTATLETAVINVPQVVCYIIELGRLTSLLRKFFLKIQWISLVNLVMNKEIVKEFFQENCTPEKVGGELRKILEDSAYREEMLQNYKLMLAKLGPPGCAERAAEEMVGLLRSY
ncbi:MAG: lipid-A-disaccharide synthase [Bacteroidetes bacterium]|nr:lipid-A-disaccharide synthase [Bacteroidota bacterium]MCL6101178.1 lipid-A-disaccharide synthase [Bacteroidota bacterium]